MKAAFSIWEERVAPVFDVAPLLVFVAVPVDGGNPPVRVTMPDTRLKTIIGALLDRHASTLVCGAISRHYQDAIEARGIVIHPFVTGELAEVIRAWRTGRLEEKQFRMPGCPPRGPRGSAAGQGHQLRWRGRGRPSAAANRGTSSQDAGIMCRCPYCGYAMRHVPGMPCNKQICPNCHAPMVRAQP